MSDGTGGEEVPRSSGAIPRSKSSRSQDEDGNDSDENTSHPDLGLGNQASMNRRSFSTDGGVSDTPRREENPFSFKHFLSREAGNGQCTGAKPKVFTSPTLSNPSDLDYSRNNSSRNLTSNPDIASALPDFVQDHLVVEQCYMRDSASSLTVDLDNLPDFAINKDNTNEVSGGCRPRNRAYGNFNRRKARPQVHNVNSIPLDLPNTSSPPTGEDIPQSGGLPFDLPGQDVSASNASGNPAQPTVSKSLPDFLSDGPIRGVHLPPADVTAEASNVSQNQIPEDRLHTENERLRRELDMMRGQNTELTRRVQTLQVELRSIRAKEHEDALTMEKAIEQAEDNLRRTTRRAVTAENSVSKLKQEVKMLMNEVKNLREENWELRGGEGASGGFDGVRASAGAGSSGPSSSSNTPENQLQMQRFAQELKAAALTAESSLRQLLSGVDNLRLLASTMETMHRVEDRTRDYLSDSDDGAGPAL